MRCSRRRGSDDRGGARERGSERKRCFDERTHVAPRVRWVDGLKLFERSSLHEPNVAFEGADVDARAAAADGEADLLAASLSARQRWTAGDAVLDRAGNAGDIEIGGD